MKRRLFAVTAVLSLTLAVVVVASWLRSYWVYDQVACGAACAWKSFDASLELPRWPLGVPEGATIAVMARTGKVSLRQATYTDAMGGPSHGYGWSSDDNVVPSFSYFYAVTGDMSRSGQWTIRQASATHWALALLFAVLPAAWLWRRRRAAKQA